MRSRAPPCGGVNWNNNKSLSKEYSYSASYMETSIETAALFWWPYPAKCSPCGNVNWNTNPSRSSLFVHAIPVWECELKHRQQNRSILRSWCFLYGSVNWNVYNLMQDYRNDVLPMWGRELKPMSAKSFFVVIAVYACQHHTVPSIPGAWIETSLFTNLTVFFSSAPHMGSVNWNWPVKRRPR